MYREWRLLMLTAAIAASLSLTACGGKTDDDNKQQVGTTAPGTSPAVSPGAAQGGGTSTVNVDTIVKQNCIACHGDTLDGRGDAKKNLQAVGARLSKEEITAVIASGRNMMPSFKSKLSDAEISALSDWLATKK